MNERVLPSPDLYAICPNEGAVLSFYEGVFESAYVLLHPFIRPVTIPVELFQAKSYPDRTTLCCCCEPVSWSEVQRLFGFTKLAEIDIALRTQIRGLRAEFANDALATKLRVSAEHEGLVEPNEGGFSDLSHDSVLSFIQKQGYDWVWVGDELCTERKLHWIDDLKNPDSTVTQGHCNVFTPDKKILWTTHWDSHFSFFCSSKETVTRLSLEASLEGFACDATTQVYWSVR